MCSGLHGKNACCNTLKMFTTCKKIKLCDVPCVPGTLESTASHGNCNIARLRVRWAEMLVSFT